MAVNETTGRIVRALSGFYDVQCGERRVTCRARGKLRTDGQCPLVGDYVNFSETNSGAMVERILPRKNYFIRPAVSNLDLLVILASGVIPVTDPFLIDRVAAIAGDRNVPVAICVNKRDLDPGVRLAEIYQKSGFPVFLTSAETGEGVQALFDAMRGKTVALTGNSGVGKSSLLNRICPALALPTGDVSEKLGRGRHTTRHVELYDLGEGTYVVDTPGFSAFDTDRMELILKENLQYAFPDFAPYLGTCQFQDCAHLREPGCRVTRAVKSGEIQASRYDSYVRLYEKAKEIKLWDLK